MQMTPKWNEMAIKLSKGELLFTHRHAHTLTTQTHKCTHIHNVYIYTHETTHSLPHTYTYVYTNTHQYIHIRLHTHTHTYTFVVEAVKSNEIQQYMRTKISF